MFNLCMWQPRQSEVTGTLLMMAENTPSKTGSLSPAEDSLANLPEPKDYNAKPTAINLKTNATGIILHPQPEDNPNDPLNWPLLRKDLCFLIIGFQTFIGGGQTPILAAGFKQLSAEFHKSTATISYLVGAFMLSLGVGSVFASPTAILYGKRLVYLLGILIFLVGAIVCASSENFGALMAGRILTGLGASPTESLASASLSDLYFQHERAYRTGLYTLLLLGGKNILPLLSSLIFQHLDRHWLYWIESMFLAMNLVLTFLFVPETYWGRSTPLRACDGQNHSLSTDQSFKTGSEQFSVDNDVPSTHSAHTPSPSEPTPLINSNSEENAEVLTPEENAAKAGPRSSGSGAFPSATDEIIPAPRSFISRLHIVSGRHSADKWWMVALRPLFLYAYPAVLYGSLVYSLAVVWLIVISEVLAEIFQAHPYGYSSQTVGLFYISPFTGGILGSLCAGILGDRVTKMLVKRNHGVFEPEFRLFMLIPSTILTCIGLMGYGWSASKGDFWVSPVVFFGCLSFGSSMASTTAITYTIDSYKMFAAEALVSFNLAKNVIGFIISLFNNKAYAAIHGKRLFVIYGCVQLIVSLLGVFVCVFGKVFRAWTDDRSLLRVLYHEDSLTDVHKDAKD